MAEIPFSFSHVPGDPTFRNAAVNAVAVVPLLSSDKDGEISTTHSVQSFGKLVSALGYRPGSEVDLLLVVPNSSLTRPGDWRYSETPLKAFHWQQGCQRIRIFDGRPQNTRLAHDRVVNHSVSRDWIDLIPSRRTAAVIGVLNLRDCADLADLHRAEEELHQWANRYATPPYEVTAHGRNFDRDWPVERLFVFESFDEECQKIDLTKSEMGNAILAFPPVEEEHSQMMDLHLNVVVNDLAVSILRNLETRIKESDAISSNALSQATTATNTGRLSLSRIMSAATTGDQREALTGEEPVSPSQRLSLSNMANFVNPDSKLAKESKSTLSPAASFSERTMTNIEVKPISAQKLLTPVDNNWDNSALAARDVDAIRKRDVARREKYAADLTLLAGSPLDAYERYLKAAEMCKTGIPDPLWYASALEGCAAAHIAMAEAGGFGVDDYLENNFQLPDEIMALAKTKDDKKSTVSGGKQTLPEVVFALCEEALNITNRHPSLGPYHAELLLKLATYVAESAEGHLRCRWGEGVGCYAGEPDDKLRWEKPSVSMLTFGELKTKDGGDMITINTFNRTKQVCELLQEAASVGSLDPVTRVDVAAKCARLCIDGVKPTNWNKKRGQRVKLPRKAAFFAVIAAEAMSAVKGGDGAGKSARDLWFLASQLYSKIGNSVDHQGDYGWAALRATTLNALSLQGNSAISLQASQDLLSVLGEITPKFPSAKSSVARYSPLKKVMEKKASDPSHVKKLSGEASKTGAVDRPASNDSIESDGGESYTTASTFARQLRDSFTNVSLVSSVLLMESKWAEGDIVRPVEVPLSQQSTSFPSAQTLGCVWQNIELSKCAEAQKRCMHRISVLRRSLPTPSSSEHRDLSSIVDLRHALPLFVSSAMVIRSEPSLELEKVPKEAKENRVSEGVMATFYNPFDKKSKVHINVIGAEEERAFSVDFGNRLSVPLEVQRCCLVFRGDVDGRIKATPLSFIVPAKMSRFTIHFPFSVLVEPEFSGPCSEEVPVYDVIGVNATIMGRAFFLPVLADDSSAKLNEVASPNLPPSASVYPYLTSRKKVSDDIELGGPRFEACPGQPRLQIVFARSGASVDSVSTIPLSLADGELFTLPPLKVKNYPGPSGHGKLERLQIFVADIPGLGGEKKLFDSESFTLESEEDFARQMIEADNPPPLKLRVFRSSLELNALNTSEQGGLVIFQVAAAHNLKQQLKNGATFRIRFKYRGSATPTFETWRRKDINVCVSLINGPRITSMDFRLDLISESAYADMRKVIESQAKQGDKLGATDGVEQSENRLDSIFRLGMDRCVHVASTRTVFVMTVANETTSKVTLSSESGPIGGFSDNPLTTLVVHPGVSAKLPVVIPRISRVDEAGDLANVLDKLVSQTSLSWQTQREDDPTCSELAKGFLRIPREALKDIISQHPSFIPRICESPCQIQLAVAGAPCTAVTTDVPLGTAMDVEVSVIGAAWLPREVASRCTIVTEFLCVRSDASTGPSGHTKDYIWCGKLRQTFRMDTTTIKHHIRVIFLNTGTFSLSACARIHHDAAPGPVEEIWLAPVAACLQVNKIHPGSQ